MLQSDNIIDEITEQSFNEIEYDTIEKLNKGINKYDWIIVYVNIRRLNSNFENLEALLNSLKFLPQVVVCSETWVLQNPNLYNIKNYKMYYNYGAINAADGVATLERISSILLKLLNLITSRFLTAKFN